MRVRILKYVLCSIVICSFEYAKNFCIDLFHVLELYVVNDRGICFRNIRILADADNQFDFNEFYESTLSLANQLGDCNDGNKEIEHLRNSIVPYIKKHKERNTSLDFKNVDSTSKKLINELRTEIDELKQQINNKPNDELAIPPIPDNILIKKDENGSVSEYEDFMQLANIENTQIASGNYSKKLKWIKKIKKEKAKLKVSYAACVAPVVLTIMTSTPYFLLLLIPSGCAMLYFLWKRYNNEDKLEEI